MSERVGAAIGTFYAGVTDWILKYWIRRLERQPEAHELDPLTRAFWEQGRTLSAGEYLLALDDLRTYTRDVAHFFRDCDLWLTPTLAQPPPRIGEMVGSDTDPMAGLRRSSQFVAFPGIVANITGNPAMSVPLFWNDGRHPDRCALPRPIRRRGNPLPARRATRTRPSVGGSATTDGRPHVGVERPSLTVTPRRTPCDGPSPRTP